MLLETSSGSFFCVLDILLLSREDCSAILFDVCTLQSSAAQDLEPRPQHSSFHGHVLYSWAATLFQTVPLFEALNGQSMIACGSSFYSSIRM